MLLLVVAALVCVIGALLIYARWNFGTLEKMGIPVVKHHPLLGSTRELYNTVGGLNDLKWMKKYGPIFGVYEGRMPQLFLCVPELVRLICVKDAEYFTLKRQVDYSDPIMNEMPDFAPYDKWKLLRSLSSPALTKAKVKMMNVPMLEATKDFIADLKRKIKTSGKGVHEKFAIDVEIHKMLTDLIGRCVFSLKINHNGGNDSDIAQAVLDLFKPVTNRIPEEVLIWSHTFPFILKFTPPIMFEKEPIDKFVNLFKQLMDVRRKTGEKYGDVVDLCMEWYDRLDTPEFKQAKITEMTIFCQALLFFFAAQDQISTMISTFIYHMTQNPDIEKKVYEELDRVFSKNNGKIGSENLSELVYMNACLQECLRLYTFFHRMERMCVKEWKNEEYNLHIKPGQIIIMPMWAINRNPEYIENPEEFIPERFLPENKDKLNVYASTAFGHGPRNCTGQRFANEVMPLISAHLLKELKFTKRIDTKLEFVQGGPFFTPHEPIYVDVMERK